MKRLFLVAAACAAVVAALAPPALAEAPVFMSPPDIDIIRGDQRLKTPPNTPNVGDTLWGNNGSPYCNPSCDPNDPSQQPQPFQNLHPGNGEPPTGQFYSWNRCTDAGCVQVQAKSSNHLYLVTAADAGARMQLVVHLTTRDCGEVVREGPDAGTQECRYTTTKGTAMSATVGQAALATVAVVPAALAEGEAGVAYSQTLTATGGTGAASFAIDSGTLPPGLTLAPGGQLTGTPTQGGSYTFTVRASAPNAVAGTRSYTVVVRLGLPAAVGNGITGVAYTQPLAAVGAPAPVSFSVTGGALPPGLSISGSQIVGTPTAQGDFTFTLNATGGGAGGFKQYTIRIAYPVLTITPANLPRAVRGVPYDVTLSASGGTAPYRWSILQGDLPKGLTLTADGRLTGVPKDDGTSAIRLKLEVKDRYGAPATKELSLAYHGPLITLAPTKPIRARVGAKFRLQLVARGGTPRYTFALVRGKLPPGLRLGARGLVLGAPTKLAKGRVTVRVTDRLGASALFTLRIEAVGAPLVAR